MTLLIRGGGKIEYDEDNVIEVPREEAAAYLEWTLWRAALAIDHLANKPYGCEVFALTPTLCLFRQQEAAKETCIANLRTTQF